MLEKWDTEGKLPVTTVGVEDVHPKRKGRICSDVIRFNPSDQHASICFLGGTANRVEGAQELTEWTWALTALV